MTRGRHHVYNDNRFGPIWALKKLSSGLEMYSNIKGVSNYHDNAGWVSNLGSPNKKMTSRRYMLSPPKTPKKYYSPSAGSGVTKRTFKLKSNATKNKATQTRRLIRAFRGQTLSSGKFPNGKKVKPFGHAAGATIINEWHGIATSDNAEKRVVTIGCASCPQLKVIETIAFALVKVLAFKMGRPFRNFNEVIPDVNVGAQMYFEYRRSNASNATTNNVFYTFAAGGTWLLAATGLYNSFIAFNGEFIITRLVFLNSVESWYVNVNDAMVRVSVKGDLKLQNRSVTITTDNEADDVNNVPLYGKMFQGSGSGLYKLPNTSSTSNEGIFANEVTGVITRNVATNTLTEPPLGYEFYDKKPLIAKAHLDPGQIKTATVQNTFVMPLNKCIMDYFVAGSRTNLVRSTKMGTYKVFVLEKLMEPFGSADVNRSELTVAYEYNLKLSAQVILKNNIVTEPYFAEST